MICETYGTYKSNCPYIDINDVKNSGFSRNHKYSDICKKRESLITK